MADNPGRTKGRGGGRKGSGRGESKGGPGTASGRGESKAGPVPAGQGDSSKGGGGRGETKARGGKGRGRGGGKSQEKGRGEGSRSGRGKSRGNNKGSPALSEEEKLRIEQEKKAAEDFAAAEAERQRLEEEQKALQKAREAKRQERKELCARVQQAMDYITGICEIVQTHKDHRAELAAESLVKHRKDFEATKKTLKADLKKCTAFVKKIKAGNAWSMKPSDMERDVASLNLSRYVEEVAAALLEAKLKVGDLPTVVALCHAMHIRYAEFLPSLLPALWNAVQSKTKDDSVKLRRVYVRLLTEFLLHGILTDHKQLLKLMSEVTGASSGYVVADANLVVSFVKAGGFELLGTNPRPIQENSRLLREQVELFDALIAEGKSMDIPDDAAPEDIPLVISSQLRENCQIALEQIQESLNERAVPPAIAEVFESHCTGAFETLTKLRVETHGKLLKLEKRCEQDRLVQGNLPEQREKGLVDARNLNENLQKTVEALAEVLDKPMPLLEHDDEEEAAGEGGPGLELWTKDGDDANNFGPFDDEETRSFYCDIPDLLTTIPPQLLGMTPEEVERLQAENLRKYGDGLDVVADESSDTEIEPITEADLDDEEEQETNATVSLEGDENKDSPHYKLQMLIEQELPECNRREQVDELAEKFCVNHGSSKNSRKRLSKALFQVPRTRLDLLPHYSRIAATVDRIYPDISAPIVVDLEQQFHGQAKFKKQQNPEGRLKTARFLGELTKFRVAPPIVALRCLRRCLDDFSGFNIDVACCILESCGRFLYRTKHTVAKLTALMDTMMRIRKTKNLDERYQALINSAFFMVKPPPAAPRKQAKVYPPLEAYLRHLLLVRLEPLESSISFVTKQLLKFPWDDQSQQCGALICRYMLKACRKGRYKVISAIAAVAANIRRNKPEVAARLVDACIEEIQWSMENPSFRDQQRTLTYARLLGEMHSVSLITGPLVVEQLHNFINFGHDIPEALRQISAKQIANSSEEKQDDLPVYNSAGPVSQAIPEDEEMEDSELETKEETQIAKVVAVSLHSKYDPRVQSAIDPPTSVFRVKLVCTLLEVSMKTLVTRSNLTILEGFIAAFQRYLYTKPILPTEVEFALLDTFDALDSQWKKTTTKDRTKTETGANAEKGSQGFPRYECWIDAHNASVEKEEELAVAEKLNRDRLEAVAGIGNLDLLNGVDLAMEDADGDDDDYDGSDVEDTDTEEEMEDDEEAGGVSIDEETATHDEEIEYEESDLETDEDGDDEDYDDEEVFDEEAYMKQLEEEAFERELRRVTMEALEKGKSTARAATSGKVADFMPSGSQFIRKKQSDTVDNDVPSFALGGQEGVSFQLLKKGNKGKVESKQLVVPRDTNLATRALKHDDAADREHDIIKARVLQYSAESANQEHGNVYLQQTKLQVIRNRPLSIEVIDKNFGTSRGDFAGRGRGQSATPGRGHPAAPTSSSSGRGGPGGSAPGRGPGRGRGSGGRTLRNF